MNESLDLTRALSVWTAMSPKNEIVSWHATDAYYTLFKKGRNIVGHLKAQSGGMSWDYPQELVDQHHLYSRQEETGDWLMKS